MEIKIPFDKESCETCHFCDDNWCSLYSEHSNSYEKSKFCEVKTLVGKDELLDKVLKLIDKINFGEYKVTKLVDQIEELRSE